MLSKYSHGSLKIEVFLSPSSPHLQTCFQGEGTRSCDNTCPANHPASG